MEVEVTHYMTTPPSQEDLFGNPATIPDGTTPPEEGAAVREVVNDMDLTQTVLADIVSDKTALLHIDDHGQVRRCAQRATEPVPADVAAVVAQLLDSHYLTTRRRSCPGHGAEITATRSGRSALCRWRAYRPPPHHLGSSAAGHVAQLSLVKRLARGKEFWH